MEFGDDFKFNQTISTADDKRNLFKNISAGLNLSTFSKSPPTSQNRQSKPSTSTHPQQTNQPTDTNDDKISSATNTSVKNVTAPNKTKGSNPKRSIKPMSSTFTNLMKKPSTALQLRCIDTNTFLAPVKDEIKANMMPFITKIVFLAGMPSCGCQAHASDNIYLNKCFKHLVTHPELGTIYSKTNDETPLDQILFEAIELCDEHQVSYGKHFSFGLMCISERMIENKIISPETNASLIQLVNVDFAMSAGIAVPTIKNCNLRKELAKLPTQVVGDVASLKTGELTHQLLIGKNKLKDRIPKELTEKLIHLAAMKAIIFDGKPMVFPMIGFGEDARRSELTATELATTIMKASDLSREPTFLFTDGIKIPMVSRRISKLEVLAAKRKIVDVLEKVNSLQKLLTSWNYDATDFRLDWDDDKNVNATPSSPAVAPTPSLVANEDVKILPNPTPEVTEEVAEMSADVINAWDVTQKFHEKYGFNIGVTTALIVEECDLASRLIDLSSNYIKIDDPSMIKLANLLQEHQTEVKSKIIVLPDLKTLYAIRDVCLIGWYSKDPNRQTHPCITVVKNAEALHASGLQDGTDDYRSLVANYYANITNDAAIKRMLMTSGTSNQDELITHAFQEYRICGKAFRNNVAAYFKNLTTQQQLTPETEDVLESLTSDATLTSETTESKINTNNAPNPEALASVETSPVEASIEVEEVSLKLTSLSTDATSHQSNNKDADVLARSDTLPLPSQVSCRTCDNLREEFDAMKDEFNGLLKTIAKFSTRITELEEAISNEKEKFLAQQQMNEQLMRTNSDQAKTIEELNLRLQQSHEHAELAINALQLEETISRMNEESSEKEKVITQQQQQIADLHLQLDTETRSAKALQDQLKRMEHQNAIKTSTEPVANLSRVEDSTTKQVIDDDLHRIMDIAREISATDTNQLQYVGAISYEHQAAAILTLQKRLRECNPIMGYQLSRYTYMWTELLIVWSKLLDLFQEVPDSFVLIESIVSLAAARGQVSLLRMYDTVDDVIAFYNNLYYMPQ